MRPNTLSEISRLHRMGMPVKDIVETLNRDGHTNEKGRPLKEGMVYYSLKRVSKKRPQSTQASSSSKPKKGGKDKLAFVESLLSNTGVSADTRIKMALMALREGN